MLKWLFGVAPEIGSVWELSRDFENPFSNTGIRVEVVDVKGRYVQYNWLWNTSKNPDYFTSKSIRDFRLIYREVKDV